MLSSITRKYSTTRKPVTLTAYNTPLQELLQLVFKEQPVSFTIQEKTIILSHQEKTNLAIERLIIDAPSVYGRIIESDDQPVLDVSIRIRGTKRGTTSGTGGRFSLDVKDGEVLDISAVGFNPIALRLNGEQFETVAANRSASRRQQADSAGENRSSQLFISNKQNVLIKLTRSNSILDEVVIIPYGKTSRRFATGNVTSIKAKEIERQPVMNILQALEGKVPGMSVSTVSGNSAAPIKVEIREDLPSMPVHW